MLGPATRQVVDLLAARHAGRDDVRVGGRRLDGGREPPIAEPGGDLVVLALEPERPGHAAAAGVDFGHVEAGPLERGDRRRRTDHRLLMAVAVEERLAAVTGEGQREPAGPLAHEELL